MEKTNHRKKKKSKITQPKKPADSNLVAFRADKELSRLLKQSTNKSEVIVEALRNHFAQHEYVTCTTCEGKGKMKQLKNNK